MKTIETNGKSVELDGEGYLARFGDWNEDVARALARDEKLELTSDHWTAVQLLRDHYAENEAIPTAKELSRLMGEKLGSEKGNHKYLTTLFPGDHLKQGGKIAGLPRMAGCT